MILIYAPGGAGGPLAVLVVAALVGWAVAFAMRKAGIIADGDMKLDR